jgi:hypothetical protein
MDELRNVQDLNLSDSYIAASAIRNTIWNYFHDYPATFNQKDIDVIYFDLNDMKGEREKISKELLTAKSPNLKWDVVNQARVHLLNYSSNFSKPAKSSCEAIAYWVETPTCVGVGLREEEGIVIRAPHGLDDLMNLVVRPVPPPYQNLPLYRQRMAEKKWITIWPKLTIINSES